MTAQGGTSAPGAILVSGRPVVTAAADVRLWRDTGLEFTGLKRRQYTRQIFLHWTGGENPPSVVLRNMRSKGLSVHFIIDVDGVVVQCCDADRLCAHAKSHNEESVGIEIVCRGSDARVKDRDVVRRDRIEMVHGRHVRYGDFTDRQKEAALDLVESLCRAYHLPMRVPLELSGDVVARVLSAKELQTFHGVLGHYHTRADKLDPAPGLLKLVSDRGRERGLG